MFLGEPCPELKEKTLRLYSMTYCPFVQRAKLVLEAKKIPLVFHVTFISMVKKDDSKNGVSLDTKRS